MGSPMISRSPHDRLKEKHFQIGKRNGPASVSSLIRLGCKQSVHCLGGASIKHFIAASPTSREVGFSYPKGQGDDR